MIETSVYTILTGAISAAVPLASMKISAVDGTAFIDCGSLGALVFARAGELLTVTDSAGKTITGFIKADGTAVMPSDLLNEDCSDISDWTDGDVRAGVSEVDPAGQFRFDTNAGAATNDYAFRNRDIAAPPGVFTIEIKTYFDSLGSFANTDYASLWYGTATWRFVADFGSDGLRIRKAAGAYTAVGSGIVKCNASAAWQTWRFEVDKQAGEASARVEVFLDGVSQGIVDCDYEVASSSGKLNFILNGYTTDNIVAHLDYIKVATGLLPAATGVTIVSTLGGTTFNWTSKDAAFNYADASGYTISRPLSGRVYPVVMSQDVVLPAVSYQRVSADPANTLSGAPGLVNAHIVINSWARTYDEAKALALEVRTAMNAATAFKSVMVNELDGYDPDAMLFVVSQDFSTWGSE